MANSQINSDNENASENIPEENTSHDWFTKANEFDKDVSTMTLDQIKMELGFRISSSPKGIYRCGKLLLAAKAELKKQQKKYLEWLSENNTFAKERMANRYCLFTAFVDDYSKESKIEKSDILSDLKNVKSDALYLIAKKSTSHETRVKIMQEIKSKNLSTKEDIKKIIQNNDPSKDLINRCPNYKTVKKSLNLSFDLLYKINLQMYSSFEKEDFQMLVDDCQRLRQSCSKIISKYSSNSNHQESVDKDIYTNSEFWPVSGEVEPKMSSNESVEESSFKSDPIKPIEETASEIAEE